MGKNIAQGLTAGLGHFMEGWTAGQRLKERKAREKQLSELRDMQLAERQEKDQFEDATLRITELPSKVYSTMGLSPLGRRYAQEFINKASGDFGAALTEFDAFFPKEQERIRAGGGAAGEGMFGDLAAGEDKSAQSRMDALQGSRAALQSLVSIDQRLRGGGMPQGPPTAAQAQASQGPSMSAGNMQLFQTLLETMKRLEDPGTNQAQLKALRGLMSSQVPIGQGHTGATR